MTEWISVKDRLPERRKKVYIYPFEAVAMLDCMDRWVDDDTRLAGQTEYRNPTHWQTLPDPPQEVE